MQKSEDSQDWDRWRILKSILDEAYKSKEEYWNRKSRVIWLQEGEKNTKFFHAVTSERRKRNIIEMLRNEDGTECRGEAKIEKEIASYFENLFTSSQPQDCE